jgi:hypothetical protein
MRERQVVAVLVRELGGARDARQRRDDAGGGEGGKGAQGTPAVSEVMSFVSVIVKFFWIVFDAI